MQSMVLNCSSLCMAKQLTQEEVDKRIAAAQEIQLDFSTATTDRIRKLVSDYAVSIGCPKEFFLLPLQSLAAHFIGPKACVQVHSSWEEPIILWSVVMAHKGQKKSPALQCFNKTLSTLEERQNADEPSDSEHPPQIFVEHFSFEELHYTMKRNNNRIVGLYDELSLLYEQLDRYKAGHADRKTILTLINGGCWRRNFRSSTSTMRHTWFNLTGFVQPGTVVELCNNKDDDGLMDRQLFSCPEEVHYDYDEYQPLPEGTPSLVDLFKEIDEAHTLSKSVYTLSDDAKQEFISIHDELNSRKREEHKFNHNHKSILSKGHGQLLRIATAKWSIEQALVRLEERKNGDTVSPWSFIIPKHIILCAKRMLDYFIAQKFAFGCQISHYSDSTQSDDDQDHGTTITNHYTLNDQPGTHPTQG